MTAIPIFPIPNCVSFPGTVFPLHVFEPRYRAMIRHCLENNQLLGIAHTQKVLSEGKSSEDQPLEQALNSNQATYKPFPIFSAGRCELLKTLDDGRLYLQVHMQSRFCAISEVQTLPFSIFNCDPYSDMPTDADTAADIETLKQKVLNRLIVMTASVPSIQEVLSADTWTQKQSVEFSFEIFGLLQFEADLQQKILEMTSAKERLNYLLDLLNRKNNA